MAQKSFYSVMVVNGEKFKVITLSGYDFRSSLDFHGSFGFLLRWQACMAVGALMFKGAHNESTV